MRKCDLFAFGANESSACMCLYQKSFPMRLDRFPAERLLHSREDRNTHSCDPRGYILTNREWFVAVTLTLTFSYTQAVQPSFPCFLVDPPLHIDRAKNSPEVSYFQDFKPDWAKSQSTRANYHDVHPSVNKLHRINFYSFIFVITSFNIFPFK